MIIRFDPKLIPQFPRGSFNLIKWFCDGHSFYAGIIPYIHGFWWVKYLNSKSSYSLYQIFDHLLQNHNDYVKRQREEMEGPVLKPVFLKLVTKLGIVSKFCHIICRDIQDTPALTLSSADLFNLKQYTAAKHIVTTWVSLRDRTGNKKNRPETVFLCHPSNVDQVVTLWEWIWYHIYVELCLFA